MNIEFEKLIIGYINQSSSVEDLKKILDKLKEPSNVSLFKSYIKINFFSIYTMNQSDTDAILKEVRSRIKLDMIFSK